MKTHPQTPRRSPPALSHLSEEQRVLVEQVSHSPGAERNIRRRASALLLLDEGAPVNAVSRRVDMDHRTVVSILLRHHRGGVYAALLGVKPSIRKRHWLALSPMPAA